MITLIKGKARKSVYMETLFRGTKNSLYVQFGDVHPIPPSDSNCWRVIPENKEIPLETYLKNILEGAATSKEGYQIMFLYANFKPSELEPLYNAYTSADCNLDIIVSVQDESIPNGKIVIEEIH